MERFIVTLSKGDKQCVYQQANKWSKGASAWLTSRKLRPLHLMTSLHSIKFIRSTHFMTNWVWMALIRSVPNLPCFDYLMEMVKKVALFLDGIDSHLTMISEYYLILHNILCFTVTPFWGDWSFWNRRIWKGKIVIVFTLRLSSFQVAFFLCNRGISLNFVITNFRPQNDSITISDIEVGEKSSMSNLCILCNSGQPSD